MTTAASDPRNMVADMLALTIGNSARGVDVRDWYELHALSVQQRCAALMWLRNGDQIRNAAPADVVSAWRSTAHSVDAEGRALLSVLGETQSLLARDGVQSVVLKGPALSLALYGPPIVRPTHDLDLYIPAGQRVAAREALLKAGWRQVEWDAASKYEVFAREAGNTTVYLDLFSSVPKHLAKMDAEAPSSVERNFDDVSVRMHWGEGLATYLAVHLAKHEFPPLLWFVDFATLWNTLTSTEQVREREHARARELDRYLDWAFARAESIPLAAARDSAALRLLGITAAGRVQPRRWWREITLAATLRGKVAAAFRWIFPAGARSPLGFASMVVRRLRHLTRYGIERVPVGTVGSADRLASHRAADDAR